MDWDVPVGYFRTNELIGSDRRYRTTRIRTMKRMRRPEEEGYFSINCNFSTNKLVRRVKYRGKTNIDLNSPNHEKRLYKISLKPMFSKIHEKKCY